MLNCIFCSKINTKQGGCMLRDQADDCPSCFGIGRKVELDSCSNCMGSGAVIEQKQSRLCPVCLGQTIAEKYIICEDCEGTGKQLKATSII